MYPRCSLYSLRARVDKGARPASMGCLCCGGWVGFRAQDLNREGRPSFPHGQSKKACRTEASLRAVFGVTWSEFPLHLVCILDARGLRPKIVPFFLSRTVRRVTFVTNPTLVERKKATISLGNMDQKAGQHRSWYRGQ